MPAHRQVGEKIATQVERVNEVALALDERLKELDATALPQPDCVKREPTTRPLVNKPEPISPTVSG